MKFFKAVLLWLFCSVAAAQAFAQTETFDMMTFTPPKGWERKEFKDRIGFSKPDRSCLVMIYESRESTGSGLSDFKSEWQERVAKQFNTTAEPKTPDVVPSKEGDAEVLMSGANFDSSGTKVSSLLVVYRTRERAMSVLGLNPNRCGAEFEDFMLKLEFSRTRKPR